MTEVLRSAIAEVEQYSRVELVPRSTAPCAGTPSPTSSTCWPNSSRTPRCSRPAHPSPVRVNLVTSGLAVEVEDPGLGMPLGERDKMNALLTDHQVDVASLLQDGRIGLFVVSSSPGGTASTYQLQTNIYGGVQAVLVVPQALLGAPSGAIGDVSQAQSQQTQQTQQSQQTQQLKAGGPRPPAGPQTGPTAPVSSAGATVASVPRQGQRDQTQLAAPGTGGSGPAPAPRARRPRGAAQPGRGPARHPARRPAVVADSPGRPPTPRNGAVRGTMGKPQAAKRRAQEHIAPQLRDGPLPRQDPEQVVGHDPV